MTKNLHELSRDILKKYITRAHTDVFRRGQDSGSGRYKTNVERDKNVDKVIQRHKYTLIALSKLEDKARKNKLDESLNDEENLQELSKKTLSSYIKKAASDATNKSFFHGKNYRMKKGKTWNKIEKRHIGINRASDKLADPEKLSAKDYIAKLRKSKEVNEAAMEAKYRFGVGDKVRLNMYGAPAEKITKISHPIVYTDKGNTYHHSKLVKIGSKSVSENVKTNSAVTIGPGTLSLVGVV